MTRMMEGFFWVGKFWQVFFFWGGGGVVFKTNVSCNAFWKVLWFRNSAWDFGGLNFGPGIFWGFVLSPREFFTF